MDFELKKENEPQRVVFFTIGMMFVSVGALYSTLESFGPLPGILFMIAGIITIGGGLYKTINNKEKKV